MTYPKAHGVSVMIWGAGGTKACREPAGFIPMEHTLSNRARDLAAAQTTGAYVDVLRGTVEDHLYALHIRLPHTVGTSVRVAHLNAERNALVTKLAFCHLMLHLLASLDKAVCFQNSPYIIPKSKRNCKRNFPGIARFWWMA